MNELAFVWNKFVGFLTLAAKCYKHNQTQRLENYKSTFYCDMIFHVSNYIIVWVGDESLSSDNTVWYQQSCLEFDSVSYLKKVRAAAGTTVAAEDAPDSPEPE